MKRLSIMSYFIKNFNNSIFFSLVTYIFFLLTTVTLTILVHTLTIKKDEKLYELSINSVANDNFYKFDKNKFECNLLVQDNKFDQNIYHILQIKSDTNKCFNQIIEDYKHQFSKYFITVIDDKNKINALLQRASKSNNSPVLSLEKLIYFKIYNLILMKQINHGDISFFLEDYLDQEFIFYSIKEWANALRNIRIIKNIVIFSCLFLLLKLILVRKKFFDQPS